MRRFPFIPVMDFALYVRHHLLFTFQPRRSTGLVLHGPDNASTTLFRIVPSCKPITMDSRLLRNQTPSQHRLRYD